MKDGIYLNEKLEGIIIKQFSYKHQRYNGVLLMTNYQSLDSPRELGLGFYKLHERCI